MAKGDQNNLYQQLIKTTHAYLGPAAERFIIRQINNHLQKTPEEITRNDLKKLLDWIRIAVSLITADSAIIDAYMKQLEELVAGKTKR